MSKLPDIVLPKSVENEVQDYFYYIRLYWNNGKYQFSKYTTAPSTTTTGQTGECRLVQEGTDVRLYVHDGTDWWKSANKMTKIA